MGTGDEGKEDIGMPVGRDFRFLLAVLWLIFRSLKLLGDGPEPAGPAPPTLEVCSIPAARVSRPPVIDGLLEAGGWAGTPSVGDFSSQEAEKPASDQTVVRTL